MASGTIAFDKSNPTGSYLEGKIEWTSVANKDANTSELTLRIYVRKRATNQQLTVPTTGAWRYEFTVNGQKIEGKSGGNTSVLQTFVLIDTMNIKNIAHNADGTKSVSIVGFVRGPSISDGYKDKRSECNAVAKMDTIPRASQITSASNVTLENNCNVKWTPASAAFRYRLEFKLGDFVGKTSIIHPNTTAAYTYTGYEIPLSAANQIPNDKTGTMTVTLTTYSDSAGTQAIGSYSKTFTVTVPDNESTKPSVEASLTPVSNLAGEYQNLYIQGYSKVKADVDAEGKYGATTNTPVLSINGVAQKSLTSGYLTSSGENTVSVSITDSRGITRTVSRTVTVIPYVKPSLKSYGIGRSADGQFKDSGTDLRIDATWDFAPVEQMNSCKLQYQLRAAGVAFDNNWTDIPSEEKAVSVVVENGLVAAENSYHVKIRVIDEIGNTAEATSDIPTDKVYWHRDGERGSLTFGGYVEEYDTFAIAPGKTFKAQGPVELGEGEGGAKSFTIDEDGSTQFHVPVLDQYSTKISNGVAQYSTEQIDPNTTLESLILTNHANGPRSGYTFYIRTTFDSKKSTTAGRAQIAEPYGTAGGVYWRVYNGAEWSAWEKLANATDIADFKVKTYSNLSQMGLSGGVTTDAAFSAMPTWSMAVITNSKTNDNYLTDRPTDYCNVVLFKSNANYGSGIATKVGSSAKETYVFDWYDGGSMNAWTPVGDVVMRKIWENGKPTSSYPATTETPNGYGDYEAALVCARLSTSAANELPPVLIRKGGNAANIYGVSSGCFARRAVSFTDAGIVFEGAGKIASYSGTYAGDSTLIIPTVIYGLKGIN